MNVLETPKSTVIVKLSPSISTTSGSVKLEVLVAYTYTDGRLYETKVGGAVLINVLVILLMVSFDSGISTTSIKK